MFALRTHSTDNSYQATRTFETYAQFVTVLTFVRHSARRACCVIAYLSACEYRKLTSPIKLRMEEIQTNAIIKCRDSILECLNCTEVLTKLYARGRLTRVQLEDIEVYLLNFATRSSCNDKFNEFEKLIRDCDSCNL